jgi:two-component system NtrC family sensor kinase
MILLTLLFVALCGVAILFQEMIVMPSFMKLERRNAQIAMNRVRTSIEHDQETFAVQIMDWANWSELHEFVRGNFSDFGLRNVTSAAMGVIQADAIWIANLDGHVLLSSDQFVHTGLALDGIVSHADALRSDLPWRGDLGSLHAASGLVNTDKGLMIVVSGPILDGSGSGPSVGMVLMGRLLTPAMIQRIEAQTDTVIVPQRHLEDGHADRLVETSEVTQVFGSFRDIYGKPVLTLRVDVPRDFTAYGRRALQFASASIVAAAIVVLIVMLVLLNRLVLAPLTRVTRHAVAIGKDPELSDRLDFKSADEFGLLADEFDGMVARLASTRKELVDQSFEAGFAEMSKGVLHNLGNALTPLGVRLDALSRRLRESPADDVRQAAAELASADCDASRKAQLLEFIDLGAREMAVMLSETSTDLETMQRQASLMRASLNWSHSRSTSCPT